MYTLHTRCLIHQYFYAALRLVYHMYLVSVFEELILNYAETTETFVIDENIYMCTAQGNFVQN